MTRDRAPGLHHRRRSPREFRAISPWFSSRRSRRSGGKQPEFGELGAQGGWRPEMDSVNAERAGSVHIRGDIVNIDGAFRIDRKAFEQQLEGAGGGLDDPLLTRDQ